jgi:hypothetical protein
MVRAERYGTLNEKASAGLLAKNHILCEPNSAPMIPGTKVHDRTIHLDAFSLFAYL